jgi:hypothetical protein
MPVFKINIQNSKQYLHAISGVTKLTPKEAELLGEIIDYMRIKKLSVLDDDVKAHITKIAGYNHPQCYYNLICSLKKKKLLLHSRKKMQLRPILLPGTTLEITFAEPVNVTALKIYETTEA